MNHAKHLGIFVKSPVPGMVKTRLTPPLTAEEACALYRAFLEDLFRRLGRLKSTRVTMFHAGDDLDPFPPIPRGWALEPQKGADLGERLQAAFGHLLAGDGRALIIGSDSPDIPVQYIQRAFRRLKHKDVALGPCADGGYYLVGLKKPTPGLFEGVSWGGDTVLAQTIDNARNHKLSLHVLPIWYDVDTEPSLRHLEAMMAARHLEGRDRLVATEAILERIRRPR